MMKTIKPKKHCVQTVNKGLFWIMAFSKADALTRWAQMYPNTPAKDSWRSLQDPDTLPVDRVLV